MNIDSINAGIPISWAHSRYPLFAEQIFLIWGKYGKRCPWDRQVDMAGRVGYAGLKF